MALRANTVESVVVGTFKDNITEPAKQASKSAGESFKSISTSAGITSGAMSKLASGLKVLAGLFAFRELKQLWNGLTNFAREHNTLASQAVAQYDLAINRLLTIIVNSKTFRDIMQSTKDLLDFITGSLIFPAKFLDATGRVISATFAAIGIEIENLFIQNFNFLAEKALWLGNKLRESIGLDPIVIRIDDSGIDYDRLKVAGDLVKAFDDLEKLRASGSRVSASSSVSKVSPISTGGNITDTAKVETDKMIEIIRKRYEYEKKLQEEANAREQAHFDFIYTIENSRMELAMKRADYEADYAEALAEREVAIQQQKSDAINGILSNLATLQNTRSRALFAIGKAAAIGQATVDTYAAANKALASAPPPFNFALMAAVIAAGLANVATIASTGFGGGGGRSGGGGGGQQRDFSTRQTAEKSNSGGGLTLNLSIDGDVIGLGDAKDFALTLGKELQKQISLDRLTGLN